MLAKKAVGIAAGIGIAGIIVYAGKTINHCKLEQSYKKPFAKRLPDIELDKIADKILKNQTVAYGFDDKVTSKADFEGVLKKLFPDSFDDRLYIHGNWNIKPILNSYDKNGNDTVETVRLLTGKYYNQFRQENVAYMDIYGISNFLEGFKGKPDINTLEEFIKISTLSEYNLSYTIKNATKKYMTDPAESKRLFATLSDAYPNFNKKEQTAIKDSAKDFIDILGDTENYNPKNIREFLYSLNKGIAYKNTWALKNLIKNENFDPIIGKKFLDSLKDKAIRCLDIGSLEEILTKPDINPKQASEKLNALGDDVLKKLGRGGAITYLRFEEFFGKNNINELTMAEKKKLMEKLVKNSSNTFASGKDLCPILPKNREEYCSLLQKLSKSIGIDTKPLSKAQAATFNEGLTKLAQDIKNVDINKIDISLKFSVQDFTKQAENLMQGLSKEAKTQVMDYFGFEIVDGKLKGYPINVNNGQKLSEIKNNKAKQVVEKLRPVVVEFSEKNPITVSCNNKAVEKELNQVLEGLPELRSIIGRTQHKTHDFTLDKHTLKVFQNVVSDPRFENLSNEDKRVISVASLLHDVTKAEGLRDELHPAESAFDAYYIIQKFNLPEQDQLKIYELIRSHN